MTRVDNPHSRLTEGARRSVPALVPVFVFGIAFGVVAREAGMSPLSVMVMSLTTFGGAAQFAAVSILDDGGSWVAAVVAAGGLNARYVPMGVVAAPAMASMPRWLQFLGLQVLIDESWAMAQTRSGIDRGILLGAGLAIYVGWAVGTLIGLVAGDILDPQQLGLDAALPALFVALIRPHLRDVMSRRAAVVSALLAALLLLVLPLGAALVIAAVIALFVARLWGSR